jgi:hypothetical protein
LDFKPEMVGSYWRQYRGAGVQLDMVAANKQPKQLLIGEAKWDKENISRAILTSLIEPSQQMPQMAEGWNVRYALLREDDFQMPPGSSRKTCYFDSFKYWRRLASLPENQGYAV